MKKQMRIQLTETKACHGGATIYRADFRTMPLIEIENLLQDDLEGYRQAGYNSFTFHRPTGTITMRKIEIKSIQDVIETDFYKIL